MVAFLSPEWFDALDRSARAAPPFELSGDAPLIIEQVAVTDDDGERTWHLTLDADGVRITVGPATHPTVRFSATAAVAEAIVRGTDDPRGAFLRGDLRIGGDTERLVAHAAALRQLDDVFAAARAELDD